MIADAFEQYAQGYDNGSGFGALDLEAVMPVTRSGEHLRWLMKNSADKFASSATGLSNDARRHGARGVDVEVGYIADGRIGARAAHVMGKDIIAMFAGLPVLLRNVFLRFEQDGVFRAMLSGDGYPASSQKPLSVRPDIAQELAGFNEVVQPEVEFGESSADTCFDIALNYVFHHELAHFWNGHVGWLEARGATAEFIDGDGEPVEINTDLHALEMDADARAFHAISIDYLAVGIENGKPFIRIPSNSANYVYYLHFVALAQLTAVNIINVLLRPDMGSDETTRHPASSLRRSWVEANLQHAFSTHPLLRGAGISDVIGRAAKASAFGLANAFGLDRAAVLKRLTSPVEPAVRLHAAYRDLYSQLLPHKRGHRLVRPRPPGMELATPAELESHALLRRHSAKKTKPSKKR